MADFESIKEKVLATAGKVANKSVGIAKVAGDKAKTVGHITKLKTEIALEKDSAKKNYVEIGRKYHEKHKHTPPDPEMKQAIEEINMSHETIAKKQREVEKLKKQLKDDYGDVAEEVKERAQDAVGVVAEKVEDVKHVVTDAAQDAVDKAQDIVDKVKGDE